MNWQPKRDVLADKQLFKDRTEIKMVPLKALQVDICQMEGQDYLSY